MEVATFVRSRPSVKSRSSPTDPVAVIIPVALMPRSERPLPSASSRLRVSVSVASNPSRMSKASVLLSTSSPPTMLTGVPPSALAKALFNSAFRRSTTPWTVGKVKLGANSKSSRKTSCLISALAFFRPCTSCSRINSASSAISRTGKTESVPFGFSPTVKLLLLGGAFGSLTYLTIIFPTPPMLANPPRAV